MKTLLLLAFFSTALLTACSKGDSMSGGGSGGGGGGGINCATVPKSFTVDVNPIVQSTCNTSGCHNAGSINGPGPLTNYNEVFAARASIRGAIASGAMPKNMTLTTAQKNSFICWIDSGAPNN